MKKSLFKISACALVFALAANCKSTNKNAKKDEVRGSGTVSQPLSTDTLKGNLKSDTLTLEKEKKYRQQDTITHTAPPNPTMNKEELDSIKKWKENQKRPVIRP